MRAQMDETNQKSVEVFYAHFPSELPVDLWSHYLAQLPENLIITNQRYRRWQDRHANLLGKMLLLQGLRKFDIGREVFSQIQYTSHDRPFLEGPVDFNISHSGNCVVCAIGTNLRIGIDIEEIKPIDFDDFTTVMNHEQWQTIKSADDPMRSFYEHWTIKESIIKADGRGVNIPLDTLDWQDGKSEYEGAAWYLQPLNIDGNYVSYLTTNYARVAVKLQKIEFSLEV